MGDPIENKKSGGFLGGLFGGGSAGGAAIDCDASVLLLDEKGKLVSKQHVIYFGNKTSQDGSVVHSGDNLTGDGDGDDEVINVNLSAISPAVHKLVFIVNIYQAKQRKQDFGLIQECLYSSSR